MNTRTVFAMAIAGTREDPAINKLTMTSLMKGKCSGPGGGRPRESSSSCFLSH